MNLPSVYMVYVFVGFCMSKDLLIKLNDWVVFTLFVTSFGSACYYQYYAYSMPSNYLVEYQSPAFVLSALFLLEFLKRKEQIFKKFAKTFIYISKISFGIYFIHIIIVEFLNNYIDFTAWRYPVKMLFLELASVGGSIIIIALLSKIKIFKKYLFMIKD